MSDLDKKVAEALGWKFMSYGIRDDKELILHHPTYDAWTYGVFTPSTNWQQAMELWDKYLKDGYLNKITQGGDYTRLVLLDENTMQVVSNTIGEDLREAICEAIIRLEGANNEH